MASYRSRALLPVIRALGYKKVYADPDRMRARIDEFVLRPSSYAPPSRLVGPSSPVQVSVDRSSGWPVYTVRPRGRGDGGQRVVYCHGGSWVQEISEDHWRFIAQLASASGATFVVPIYPLAPFGTAAEVVPMIADLVRAEVDSVGPDRVVLMGDSAGGQIALSAALLVSHAGIQLRDILLVAPALEVTLKNPAIAAVEAVDPWLAPPGLRMCGELWRGDLAVDDPLVSPLEATSEEFGALGPMAILAGTFDLVIADCRLLAQRARAAGVAVDLFEAEGQVHAYPLMRVPEGKQARRMLAGRLR